MVCWHVDRLTRSPREPEEVIDLHDKEWLTARDQLSAAADALTAELSRTQHGRALAHFATLTGTVWDRWDNQMTTGARRAFIQAVAAAIPVHPATGLG